MWRESAILQPDIRKEAGAQEGRSGGAWGHQEKEPGARKVEAAAGSFTTCEDRKII